MLCGCKDNSLLWWLDHIAQQMKQDGRLVIGTTLQKCQLHTPANDVNSDLTVQHSTVFHSMLTTKYINKDRIYESDKCRKRYLYYCHMITLTYTKYTSLTNMERQHFHSPIHRYNACKEKGAGKWSHTRLLKYSNQRLDRRMVNII